MAEKGRAVEGRRPAWAMAAFLVGGMALGGALSGYPWPAAFLAGLSLGSGATWLLMAFQGGIGANKGGKRSDE